MIAAEAYSVRQIVALIRYLQDPTGWVCLTAVAWCNPTNQRFQSAGRQRAVDRAAQAVVDGFSPKRKSRVNEK